MPRRANLRTTVRYVHDSRGMPSRRATLSPARSGRQPGIPAYRHRHGENGHRPVPVHGSPSPVGWCSRTPERSASRHVPRRQPRRSPLGGPPPVPTLLVPCHPPSGYAPLARHAAIWPRTEAAGSARLYRRHWSVRRQRNAQRSSGIRTTLGGPPPPCLECSPRVHRRATAQGPRRRRPKVVLQRHLLQRGRLRVHQDT